VRRRHCSSSKCAPYKPVGCSLQDPVLRRWSCSRSDRGLRIAVTNDQNEWLEEVSDRMAAHIFQTEPWSLPLMLASHSKLLPDRQGLGVVLMVSPTKDLRRAHRPFTFKKLKASGFASRWFSLTCEICDGIKRLTSVVSFAYKLKPTSKRTWPLG
jgi:hypothetical protein